MNKRMRTKHYSIFGFTLLEILVAIGVLMIGIIGILPLFFVGATSHKVGVDHTQAALISRSIATEIASNFYTDKPQDIKDKAVTGYSSNYTYDAVFAPLVRNDTDRNAFILKVTVKWLAKGKVEIETFETVVLRQPEIDRKQR
ncbi:MAG: hypothetical protein A2W23_05750 [Planctomycetes bacterium RBG_16_43_13]|nr:MAG: hypothetical protein A2W23_05750 [Planctomycetes bacterium RBG_16_43_13]